MENYISKQEFHYKDLEEFKEAVNQVIENLISHEERLVFAAVAEKAGITPFTIRKYPELREYVLERIKYCKEARVIDEKLERAAKALAGADKRVTFMAVINRCRFSIDFINKNQYAKDKLRHILCIYN